VRILALDLSTKTGWSCFDDGKLVDSGTLTKVEIHDFNVNKHPNLSGHYPRNIANAAKDVAAHVARLVVDVAPDIVVVENSVKGRNRHTQRYIEWMHLYVLIALNFNVTYMDPSEWRKIVDLRLSKVDKDNNKAVKKKEKRGKITRKHLSVRLANALFNLQLKIKDNDRADALLLGYAAWIKLNK
jgi:hypothetical protein